MLTSVLPSYWDLLLDAASAAPVFALGAAAQAGLMRRPAPRGSRIGVACAAAVLAWLATPLVFLRATLPLVRAPDLLGGWLFLPAALATAVATGALALDRLLAAPRRPPSRPAG